MSRLYIFLLLAGLSLAGCHKVTVGYMKTEHAAYPIDSLQIYDTIAIRTEIARLEKAGVSVYDSLEFVWQKLDEEYNKIYDEEYYDKWFETIREPGVKLDELLEDSIKHVTEIIELKEKIAKNKEMLQPIVDKLDAIDAKKQEVQDKMDKLDPSETTTDRNVLKMLEEYRMRQKNHVSWTTSEIEGVDGTAPIFYYIAGVRAEKGGDADIFRSELIIKGNGRFEVPYDFKAPAGYYHVSIRIENEGYSRVLDDVFTFIIN